MSDTPETDAEIGPMIGNRDAMWVSAAFARKLERERDEARRELAEARAIIERMDRTIDSLSG